MVTCGTLMRIIKDSGLSPESFAERLGISGMTLRRWRDLPQTKPIPKLYRDALNRVILDLVREKHISPDLASVKGFLTDDWLQMDAAASGIGISTDTLEALKSEPDGAIRTLNQLGEDPKRRACAGRDRRASFRGAADPDRPAGLVLSGLRIVGVEPRMVDGQAATSDNPDMIIAVFGEKRRHER